MLVRHLVFSIVLLATGVGSATAQLSPDRTKPSAPDLSGLEQKHGNTLKVLPSPYSGPVTLGQEASLCYTMRSYQFARNDPSSDSVTLRNETTCQSAALFQMKDALSLPQAAPR
jgi:hypothetical protein